MRQLVKSIDTCKCVSDICEKSVNLSNVYKTISAIKTRSAWDRGVRDTALDILEAVKDWTPIVELSKIEETCLNGASSWRDYSWGGCLLIYDADIAERFCPPSVIKKLTNKCGLRNPNRFEEWLDVQARGARLAFGLILRTARIL